MDDLAALMPLSKMLGVTTTQADPAEVVGEMLVTADHCTLGDSVHGGALMAFADSLAAIGAFLNLPEGAGGTTTIESKTNFISGAPVGTVLRGRSTPVSIGRRISVWQTHILRDDDTLVATVIQTQLVL